jgi:hypothetical protein
MAGVEIRRLGGEEQPLGTRVRKPLRTSRERSLSSNIHCVSGERNTVGPSALTVMPLSPHSQPSALVMPSTADFEAQ